MVYVKWVITTSIEMGRSAFSKRAKGKLILHALKKGYVIPGFDDAMRTSGNVWILGPDRDHREHLIEGLSNKSTIIGTFNLINRYIKLSDEVLEEICKELFSTMISFCVFGCPDSTDIDVVVVVDKQSNGDPRPLLTSEYGRLVEELTELGYDLDVRSLDYNLIVINPDEKRIIASTKGGDETQNMVNLTHMFHKQMYPHPDMAMVKVKMSDKLRAFSKYVLNYLEYIVEDYQGLRERKKEVYREGVESIMAYVDTLQPLFIVQSDQKRWFNTMKAIVMKYCQMVLLNSDILLYTKAEICDAMRSITPDVVDGIEWFMFRGKRGTFNSNTIPTLHRYYSTYLKEHLNRFDVKTIKIRKRDIANPTDLPDDLFQEFLTSPTQHTFKFQEMWIDTYGDSTINSMFKIKSSDEETVYSVLPEEFRSHLILMDQRSPEWLELLKFYSCGKNSKIIGDDFRSKFNLIRGAITELIAMKTFNASVVDEKFTKCSVGFVVSEIGVEGSNGSAPDMLLMSDDEIVPVEIKTLKSGKINSDYYRGIELAQMQCKGIKDILHSCSSSIKMERAVMIMINFEGDDMVQRVLEFAI